MVKIDRNYTKSIEKINTIKKELYLKWIEVLQQALPKTSMEIAGSSPPSVFVGSYGYPRVRIGPMVPPIHGDTSILDTPELWIGKSIQEIAGFRLSLIRGTSTFNAYKVNGKFIESLQEVSMSKNSSEIEMILEKRPIINESLSSLDSESIPFGPTAPIKSFKSLSLKTDHRIEKYYYDKDLDASKAMYELYKREIGISKISKILSVGMLGLEKKRKITPSKWSITAVDSTISKRLIDIVRNFETIDKYRVLSYAHLGNVYSILLMPEIWNYELQEVWIDGRGNIEVSIDFENSKGLDYYPQAAGAYFASRLAVLEYLIKIKRKASILAVREIHPEYFLPVGVWQVREGIREAANNERNFDDLDQAIRFATSNLSISKTDLIRNSKLLKYNKEQKKISEFFIR